MCNFSNNNQSNQSAKSIIDQQAQATAIMKKIAEECAIKDSEKSGLYSSIPMSINIVIGDFNIFCNNEAYRSKAKPKKRGAKRRINAPTPDVASPSHNATTINQQQQSENEGIISGSKLYGMLADALTPDEGAIVKFSFKDGYFQLRTTRDFFSPTQSSLDEMIIGLRKETGDGKLILSSVNYIKIRMMDNVPKEYWYAIYKKLRTKFGPYQVRIYL